MSSWGGLTLTNKGMILQGKAQAGAQLKYTRIAVGDGTLSGQSVPALNSLISQKKNLPITRLRTQLPNKAMIGTTLSNADVTAGFYFREVGVFATDPDVGEILYAYANSGFTADYIAPSGDGIIEKTFDAVVVIGTAANVSAIIDDSLVFTRESEFLTHKHTGAAGDAPKIGSDGLASAAVGTVHIGAKAVTQAKIADKAVGTGQIADNAVSPAQLSFDPATQEELNSHAGDNTIHVTSAKKIEWDAKETPAGAQAKADAAKAASIPIGQKGIPDGVAALDTNKNVQVDGVNMAGAWTERVYFTGFVNGVSNQKVALSLPSEFMGLIEITITGSFNNSVLSGNIKKTYSVCVGAGGQLYERSAIYSSVIGAVKHSVSLSDLTWNETSKKWEITIEQRGTAGNSYAIKVDAFNALSANTFMTLGNVYIGADTTLPLAVQMIPDDVVTPSGYKIEHSGRKNVAHGYAGLDTDAHILPANLPYGSVVNLLADSGRHSANSDPVSINCSDLFASNNAFDVGFNGGTVVSAGKFIHDNTTNGGTRGTLTADVTSLITALQAKGSAIGRYGPEFHIASYTQGAGTNVPHPNVATAYLLTVCNSIPALGLGMLATFSFWFRLKTGTSAVIARSHVLRKNGVTVSAAYLTLTPADGWVHIESIQRATNGYSNSAPGIYVASGEVAQIALPVVVLGGIGVGVHFTPIMSANVGYTPSDVLSKLLIVDGAGSELDADKVHGMLPTTTGSPNTIVSRNEIGDSAFRAVFAELLCSEAAEGTPPIVVNSTALVSKLNVGLHEGKTLAEVVQGTMSYLGTLKGIAPNFTGSATPPIAVLAAGQRFSFKSPSNTTGPITLNADVKGAKSIKKPNGNNPTLALGGVYTVVYDGTDFILQGEGGDYGTAVAAEVLAGKTIGTESGIVTGTMADKRNVTSDSVGATLSGGDLYLNTPEGYYNSVSSIRVKENNLADTSNWRTDRTMFGKAGTMPVISAGDDVATGVGRWTNGDLAAYPREGYRKGGAGAGELKVTVAQLASVGYVRRATGTTTTYGSMSSQSIDGTARTYPYITVTGVGFRPTYVRAWQLEYPDTWFILTKNYCIYASSFSITWTHSTGANNPEIHFTDDGFQMTANLSAGKTVLWEAW